MGYGGGGQQPSNIYQSQPLPTQTQPLPAAAAPQAPGAPAASGDIRQQFMSPNMTAPYYNMAGVAGNLGTMVGQNAPAAAGFMGSLFQPELNPMAQAYMQAGLGNSLTGLEQGMMRAEDQYEGTPFHSSLPRAQGEVMEQFSRDAMQTAGQLGMQQQQLAAQAAPFNLQVPLQAAQAPVAAAEGMFNLGQQAYDSDTKLPMQFYQQYPVQSSTVVASQGGGGGKG